MRMFSSKQSCCQDEGPTKHPFGFGFPLQNPKDLEELSNFRAWPCDRNRSPEISVSSNLERVENNCAKKLMFSSPSTKSKLITCDLQDGIVFKLGLVHVVFLQSRIGQTLQLQPPTKGCQKRHTQHHGRQSGRKKGIRCWGEFGHSIQPLDSGKMGVEWLNRLHLNRLPKGEGSGKKSPPNLVCSRQKGTIPTTSTSAKGGPDILKGHFGQIGSHWKALKEEVSVCEDLAPLPEISPG